MSPTPSSSAPPARRRQARREAGWRAAWREAASRLPTATTSITKKNASLSVVRRPGWADHSVSRSVSSSAQMARPSRRARALPRGRGRPATGGSGPQAKRPARARPPAASAIVGKSNGIGVVYTLKRKSITSPSCTT